MKVLRPTLVLVLATQSIPGVFSKCFFGEFKCADGGKYCFNPASVLSCTFNAVSPLVLDKIIPAVGNALKAITPDQVDFVIDFGMKEVTDVFTDFRDCFKMFGGNVTKCDVLHDVHACASAGLDLAKGLKAAGKFEKLAVDKLEKANSALGLIENEVIPRLQEQCAGGCFNAPTCSVASASARVVQTTTTTTVTECYNTTVDPIPVTLTYSSPQGCTCLNMSAHSYDGDADAITTDKCALNLAFFMMDQTPPKLLGKAIFPEMGCFVGMSENGCEGATQLQASDVDMTYDIQWDMADIHNAYFIPCVDQFGRKYSERNKTVTVAPTPAPTYCKTYNVTNTTNTTTNTSTTTKTAASVATVWERSFFNMVALCIAMLAVSTWWLQI